MKRLGLTLALSPAMLFVFTALHASDTPAASGTGPTPVPSTEVSANSGTGSDSKSLKANRKKDLITRFDKNGDGKLDRQERAAAYGASRDGGDAEDPSGTAPRAETQRNRPKVAEHGGMGGLTREQALKRFDQDGDGKLDSAERAAAKEQLPQARKNHAQKAAGGLRQEFVSRYDANSDGKIDDAEWNTLQASLRSRIESVPAQLKRHDINKDGRIDDSEWAAASTQMMRWLNQTPPAEGKGAKRKVSSAK